MAAIKVLGLGNVLMGDDGFGPYVIKTLEAAYEFPREVSVVEVGTPGLDLVPYISGAATLVIVDTVRSSGRPGELRQYRRDDLERHPLPPRLGPHDPGLNGALGALRLEGRGPDDVLLIGVIPARMETGAGLSPAVFAAVPEAAGAVVRALAERGASASPRVPPNEPDIWWERPATARTARPPLGRNGGRACTR